MGVRNFNGAYGISEDYLKLHDFLVESGNPEFTYARLDWMITHRPYLQEDNLCKIGIWEDGGKIVAADLFDTGLSDIFPVVLHGYEYLYPEMLTYAKEHMGAPENTKFQIFINKDNVPLQEAAKAQGYYRTEWKEAIARYDMTEKIPEHKLSEGYRIVSLYEERDYENYAHCLFRGFEHEARGEVFTFGEEDRREYQSAMERLMVDLKLKLNVKTPDGLYVSHCGMWYDSKSEFAVIEPVATDPAYRKLGLGTAVVHEGLRLTKKLGAKYAYVGSDQQFYYSLGMKPYTEGYFWKPVERANF